MSCWRIVLVLALWLAGVGLARADDDNGAGGAAPRIVRIQLKWTHQFQGAGFYAALEQGYFKDAGLDVRLLPGGPDIDPAQVVAAGQAEFGVGNSSLLISRAWGAPVVAVAAIFQHSPFVLAVSRARGLDHPQDLEGRLVMLEAHAGELMAYLRRAGVDLSALRQVPHNGDVHSLGHGIDAMSAYSSDEVYTLLTNKIAHQIFNPRSLGLDFYGDTLFTSSSLAARDPALVRAVRDAVAKGWYYALDHTNDMLRLITRRYAPDLDPLKLQFEADETRRLIEADVVGIGYMNRRRWQSISDSFQQTGLIAAPVDLDEFLFETARQDEAPRPWPIYALAAAGGVIVVLGGLCLMLLARLRGLRARVG